MRVVLRSSHPPLKLDCLLDEGSPEITGGYGGIEEVERPRRLPITEWRQGVPFRMTIPLMLDHFASGRSVEGDVKTLERMGRDPGGDAPPPILKAFGPIPHSGSINWWVEGIEWGDAIWKGNSRTRQQAVVTLLQRVEDEHLRTLRKPKHKKRRRYKWRKGDHLQRVAQKYLGSAKRWREIARLNHIRDPKHIKPGRILKLPE